MLENSTPEQIDMLIIIASGVGAFMLIALVLGIAKVVMDRRNRGRRRHHHHPTT